MLNIQQNNLHLSKTPYLLQHSENPVWWQEWSDEIIKEAIGQNRPLFVSSGYSACHWCHVMAQGAFSDRETADYMNENFICIKIDREQRPDIDQYLMSFLTATTGSGGWPLNAFLTPDLRPVFAFTYAPARPERGMHSLHEIAKEIRAFYAEKREGIPIFHSAEERPPDADGDTLVEKLYSSFDAQNGGFGTAQKFPPHSTLLYLLYFICEENSVNARTICVKTLDSIMLGGLSDHLQGGIFRYCVDRRWTIPHFEKMLYDQAMALWCYSLAFRVLKNKRYRLMAEKTLRCLEDSFEDNKTGLYITAYDADTDHVEGATYLWTYSELKSLMTEDEFKLFCSVYDILPEGNFEGANHLVRKKDIPLKNIEDRLVHLRSQRPQPARDLKILTGLNALTAAAMIQAGRSMNMPELEHKAGDTVRRILETFRENGSLGHSLYSGTVQKQSFLFDAAALALAAGMLCETDESWRPEMLWAADYLKTFNDSGQWIESRCADFITVYASQFDQPIPSGISIAEMALIRAGILTQNEKQAGVYRESFYADFFNIGVMISRGLFHVITSENPVEWHRLPPNSIQMKGEKQTDCYRGKCSILDLRENKT